jgi:sugar phosphate isomerase/epimerase
MQRRTFLAAGAAASTALLAKRHAIANEPAPSTMAYGLVTYMWAAEWDLPTLIANCEKTKVLGVELRTTHKHGVEPALSKQQRDDVRARFADSDVVLVGLGSNERFDSPDPAAVKKAIEVSKEFVTLSHDIGGTGVKVKPDTLHKDVPREKTIEQIGKALNELGEFAGGYGQQIRLEVHGGCAELPTIKAIMDVADNENVFVCWNSNPQDLQGEGLEHNFNLVRKRFGRTLHARPLDDKEYPFARLIELLVKSQYDGWVMLEDGRVPKDIVGELARQRKLFDEMVTAAVKK